MKNLAKKHKSEILDDFFSVTDEKSYAKTERNMLLAMRIDKARIEKGLNKIKFAKEIGVKPSVITKWLSGTHNFTMDTLYEIEDFLDICIINTTSLQHIETIKTLKVEVSTSNKPLNNPYYSGYPYGRLLSTCNKTKYAHVKR